MGKDWNEEKMYPLKVFSLFYVFKLYGNWFVAREKFIIKVDLKVDLKVHFRKHKTNLAQIVKCLVLKEIHEKLFPF